MGRRVKAVGTLLRMNTEAETEGKRRGQPTPATIHGPIEVPRLD